VEGIGIQSLEQAADDHGGVQPGRVQDLRDHGCGGGLTVGPGYGNGVFDPHELGQHLGPGDDGQSHFPGPDHLRIL